MAIKKWYDLLALIYAVLSFSVSSVGMMLTNKLAVMALPLPCGLILVQLLVALLFLIPFRSQIEIISLQKARQWFPVALLFSLMLYSSMESFLYANISAVIIIRNLGPIVTTLAEYYVLGESVNTEVVFSLFTIFFGAILYGWTSSTFSIVGLFWMITNLLCQVSYGIVVRRKTSNVESFFFASKYTLTLYNNALAIPLFFCLFVFKEVEQVSYFLFNLSFLNYFCIGITCLLGFMISTSGFDLQKLVSAATFIVISNMIKIFNIMLGVFVLGDFMGPTDATGCIIVFAGGVWYSVARYRLLLPVKHQKTTDV